MGFTEFLQEAAQNEEYAHFTVQELKKMYQEETRETERYENNYNGELAPYRYEPLNPHLYYR